MRELRESGGGWDERCEEWKEGRKEGGFRGLMVCK